MALLPLPGRAQQPANTLPGWEQWNSPVPAWLQDAKFGIYFHWGVYTVPAYNSEWYSRSMYVPGTGPYRHQDSVYGPRTQFGYKEFIPMFQAPRFNADEWVDLFVRAGARFAGPVAEHADGFSMWDSRVNPWNAKNMGPKRDIVGLMEKAVRKRQLKFITTFHHQWLWGWYPTFDSSLDAGNPKYAALYGPRVSTAAWQQKDSAERPNDAFCATWLAKVQEVVGKYHPDLLYFDSRLGHIGESYRKQVVQTFQGSAKDRGKKVILYKGKDLPEGIGVRTYEKSRMNRMNETTWLTEEPISTYSWSYTQDMVLRPAEDIVKGMVDIVSKNGVYLLNICPKADGTIPQEQQAILLAIGGWLKKYGEAVYGTRTWHTYGEGPRKDGEEKVDPADRKKYHTLKFTAEDIRYTRKGNVVYAISLGRPSGTLLLRSFKGDATPQTKVSRVTMPGSSAKIKWTQTAEGVSIEVPAGVTGEMPAVFKMETKGI
ncbi:alpha-L-fucosidase [Paraflavisolibacter sp. H34]|uniref:alpha-L-fucosidase n=1 Tax=Huijunlia imazamoxiresistens TaxID=3127457 RepID=UPI003017CD48